MSAIQTLAQILTTQHLIISTAESCTGGALAAQLTSLSGSSSYFERGFITYSNQAKIDVLGVKQNTLSEFGAVSEAVVIEMVRGLANVTQADIGVSVSGIAGPTGGSADKPVGTVCFGFYIQGDIAAKTQHFTGDRTAIINQSVTFVINTLIENLTRTAASHETDKSD